MGIYRKGFFLELNPDRDYLLERPKERVISYHVYSDLNADYTKARVWVKLNGTPGLTGEVPMPEFCSAVSGTLKMDGPLCAVGAVMSRIKRTEVDA